ncbi:MAG: hypothetical protein CME64_05800 [Halobacteriovoraceae bacterium]|nr:hypothetical protein [Halobacteriovoraceae bacterium]|tara:strand:+ start:184700 stop:186073 length:1374 start_codon:yes stop_codon:yes gene_type:complete
MSRLFRSLLLLPLIVSCGAKIEELALEAKSATDQADQVEEEIVKISTVGALDSAFGQGNGFSVTGSADGDDYMRASSVDSEGRIVVVGAIKKVATGLDMAVWRFNSDGTPDTSFGNSGVFTHHNAAGGTGVVDVATSLDIDSEGNIFVGGYSERADKNLDIAVWKLDPSGVLDNSFNGDGVFTENDTAGGNGDDKVSNLILDSNGKIILGGTSKSSSNTRTVVWRLTLSGTLDTTFGDFSLGRRVIPDDFKAESMVLDSDDNVILGGYNDPSLKREMHIYKLTSAGAEDSAFGGGNGFVKYTSPGMSSDDGVFSVTVDKDQNILATGSFDDDMSIVKYSSSGVLDTSFGTSGLVTHDLSGGNADIGNAITLDHEGNILVAGKSNNGVDDDMVLWKYTSNGVLDTSFAGGAGYMSIDGTAGGGDDEAMGISLDKTGHILVTGKSSNGTDHDAVIWRIK